MWILVQRCTLMRIWLAVYTVWTAVLLWLYIKNWPGQVALPCGLWLGWDLDWCC